MSDLNHRPVVAEGASPPGDGVDPRKMEFVPEGPVAKSGKGKKKPKEGRSATQRRLAKIDAYHDEREDGASKQPKSSKASKRQQGARQANDFGEEGDDEQVLDEAIREVEREKRTIRLRLFRNLLYLFAVTVLYSRQDMATAYGVGTGVSRAHVSPISVVSHYVMSPAFKATSPLNDYPKVNQALKKICIAMAVPGEAYRIYIAEPFLLPEKKKKEKSQDKDNKKPLDLHAEAVKWSEKNLRDKGIQRVIQDNVAIVAGGLFVILGAFIGTVSASNGLFLYLLGTGIMFASLASRSANPNFTPLGIGLVLALLVFLFLFDGEPGNTSKKAKTR